MPNFGELNFVNGRFIKERDPVPEWFKKDDGPQLAHPSPAPKVGLLTHAVVQSPVSHWILPITCGKEDYSDIAFIGDNSIRIKRLNTSGQLSTLWEIHNIKTRIRNATALCCQQWLVLALEDGDLLFVTHLDGLSNGFEPTFSRYHSPDMRLATEFPGTEITIDPRSRYVAVACARNLILVVAATSKYVVQIQQLNTERPQCVLSEGLVNIKGAILKMDFLHPSPDDPDLVLLLIVAAHNGEFRIHLFQWDAAEEPLRITTHHSEMGFQLPGSHQKDVPLMLIPLSDAGPAAFLLVYESCMLLCGGLLGTDFDVLYRPLPYQAPASSHKSLNKPLWVSWYKSPAAENNFYVLVREDGVSTRISGRSGKPIDTHSDTVMILPGTVANIAAVCIKRSAEDGAEFIYILYGAETGPGAIYQLTRNCIAMHANIASTIPNWAPLNDFHGTPATTQTSPFTSQPITTPGKIYGCSGKGNEGVALKLNRKIESFVRFTLGGHVFTNVNGLWAIPDARQRQCCTIGCLSCKPDILVSLPNCSMLLRQSVGEDDLHNISQEDTWLDLSSRTFDASFGKDVSIQVTANKVVVSKAGLDFLSVTSVQQNHIPIASTVPGELVLAAASSGIYFCVSILSPNDGHRLDFFSVSNSLKGTLKPPWLIHRSLVWKDIYPASLALTCIGEAVFVALGCIGMLNYSGDAENNVCGSVGSLYTMAVGQPRGRHFAKEDLEIGDCVSIGYLTVEDDALACLVLSGHRDGTLSGWHCTATPTHLQYLHANSFHKRLGTSEVQVCVDSSNTTTALVSCGSAVYRISYNWASKLPQLTKVPLPENTVPSSILPKTLVSNYGKDFLITSGFEIMGVELGEETVGFFDIYRDKSPFPKRTLPGPATIMLASDDLRGLLVAGTHTDSLGRPDGPAIIGYSSDGTSVEGLFRLQSRTHDFKRRPEEITCMIEFLTSEKKQKKLVLVGTSRGALALGAWKLGRAREEPPPYALACLDMPWPIYALIQHPEDGQYVYACVGTELLLLRFMHCFGGGMEIRTQTAYKLPSRGVAMSYTNYPDHKLTVLTAQHSIITFAVSNSNIEVSTKIVDKQLRNGLDLHTFQSAGSSFIVLVTDSDCGVTGLWRNSSVQQRDTTAEFEKLFEAELPVSIKKFRLVESRQTWDSQPASCLAYEKEIMLHASKDPHSQRKLLGIALNGSVHHFIILREPLWQLLALLQHFALQIPEMCPVLSTIVSSDMSQETLDNMFYYLPSTMAGKRDMHIDGDLIKEWLRLRNLGKFLIVYQMKTPHKLSMKVVMFLEATHKYHQEWQIEVGKLKLVSRQRYWDVENTAILYQLVEKVYDLLEYLFRPVF